MDIKNTFKNIAGIALSNCTTIVSGLIVGFLVPKMLSVEGYGLYKTFTLYTTYIGFFSLGMIDGIVLDYGDKDFDKLDRPTFRGYFKWYFLINSFFALIIFGIGVLIGNRDLKFILIMVSIYMIAVNFMGYYQQISQCTQRFKEYSVRKILQSVLNILIVGFLFAVYLKQGAIDYEWYIFLLILINVALTVWYIYTYREISFGKAAVLFELKSQVIHLIKIGLPLLVANLCSTLILTLDRQFVNILFNTSEYAVYAFAYSMLSLVTVATSAFSVVLYPALKRTTDETMKDNFDLLICAVLVLIYGAISIYFPMNFFIKWFLPGYADSLIIFRIIFPGIAISSAITVVIHNYYKVLGENYSYFKKTILVLLVSIGTNSIAYVCFKSTYAISIASIITMIFWYLYVERYFVERYMYNGKSNFFYLIAMIGGFYLITENQSQTLGFVLYLCFYILITMFIYHSKLKKYYLRFFR